MCESGGFRVWGIGLVGRMAFPVVVRTEEWVGVREVIEYW